MKNTIIISSLIPISFPPSVCDETTQIVWDVVITGTLYQLLIQDLITISRFLGGMYSILRNKSQKTF